MLLPTITYIPSILAYIFIALLIFILGFIVLYITHKIYGYVYDNLPLVHLTAEEMDEKRNGRKNQSCTNSKKRKGNPALRVYVHLEPCNLAYYIMERKSLPPGLTNYQEQPARLIKYFDSLSAIPRSETADRRLSKNVWQEQ